jgi:hypothetical protein
MALKSELMASGMPAAQARLIGFDPIAAFVSAGTTQLNATLLTANAAIVTATTSGQGVILADAQQIYYIFNNDATNAINVYPPVGANFVSKTVNTPISLPLGKSLDVYPAGSNGIQYGQNS